MTGGGDSVGLTLPMTKHTTDEEEFDCLTEYFDLKIVF